MQQLIASLLVLTTDALESLYACEMQVRSLDTANSSQSITWRDPAFNCTTVTGSHLHGLGLRGSTSN